MNNYLTFVYVYWNRSIQYALCFKVVFIFRNRPEILEMLLQHGANVNLKNDEKSTALHLAVAKQQVKSVALLLKYKADVRQQV